MYIHSLSPRNGLSKATEIDQSEYAHQNVQRTPVVEAASRNKVYKQPTHHLSKAPSRVLCGTNEETERDKDYNVDFSLLIRKRKNSLLKEDLKSTLQ